MFDVFVCYSWDEDKAWAEELHAGLATRGVDVFKDDKNIPYGNTLAPALREALLGSRMLVPLIGPRFHDSPSCRHELLLALTAAYRLGDGSTERVMPIIWRVRPSELRPQQLKRPRLILREEVGVAAQAAAIAAKLAQLKATDGRRFGDAPASPDPTWYPRPLATNKRFRGRGEVMWDIHEALLVKDKPGNRGHPVASITGAGGQGKSTLCEQYARFFAEDHPGGVFVIRLDGSDRRARTDASVMFNGFHRQLRVFADEFGVPAGLDRDATARVLASALAELPPYLWIVDDVPSTVTPQQLELLVAPTANGKSLLSTRGQLAKHVSVEVRLEELRRRDCMDILTVEKPLAEDAKSERDAAQAMAEDLGRLPLGLTIAAGLTTQPTFTTYQALRVELNTPGPDALEMAHHLADELPVGYAQPLSSALIRSFAGLTDAGRTALAATSILGTAPVPVGLVEGILGRIGGSPAEPGLQRMAARGLARDLGDNSYLLHALVARAARIHFPSPHLQRLYDAAAEVVGETLVAGQGDFAKSRDAEPYLAHAIALATTTEWPIGSAQRYMLNEAGRSQYELGDTAGALQAMTLLLDLCERSPEVDEETILAVRVNLGATHFGQGNLDEALTIQQEVATRFEALRGADDHATLQAKENLANTLSTRGDAPAARDILADVYRTRRDSEGRTSPAALTALNNLVIAVGRCGSRRLALRLALGGWALWHRAAGPDKRETLECVENIGNNLLFLGHLDEAAATHAYVAERRRLVLGPDHPDTIDAVENMATAGHQSYWPIYAERLRAHGPTHPDTLNTLRRVLRTHLRRTPGTSDAPPTAVGEAVGAVRLDDERAGLFAEIVALAAEFEDQEGTHGPDDPRALRAKVLLAHALAAADQLDGQLEAALVIVSDSRDGLEEAAARRPDTIEPYDLAIAQAIHHWVLRLTGDEPSY